MSEMFKYVGGEGLKVLHSNNERCIVQLSGGWLDGAIVTINDEGLKIHRLPGESKSRKKRIEWADLMVMNESLSYYDPDEGVFELEFILELLKAAAFIFEGREI